MYPFTPFSWQSILRGTTGQTGAAFDDVWGEDMGDSNVLRMQGLPVQHRTQAQPLPNPPHVTYGAAARPDDSGSYGLFMPKSVNGTHLDEGDARRIRGEALVSLGTSLLADPNHPGTALAQGLQGFSGTLHDRYAEHRDVARQRAADERAATAAEDAHAGALQNREIGGAQLAHQQGEWAEEDAKRQHTAAAAGQMVAAIEKTAGPDSPEAQRARALAALGEDADVTRLAALHDDVVARQRAPEDARLKSQAEIDAIKARIAAGVLEDPLAAGRREEERIGISREGLAIERQRAASYDAQVQKQLNRDPRITPQQFNDDVSAEAKALYDQKLVELKEKAGNGLPLRPDPARPGRLIPSIPFNQHDLDRIRREANDEAAVRVKQRYGAAPGVSGGVYHYDAQGNLVAGPP